MTLREKYAIIRALNPTLTLEEAATQAGYAGRAPAEADRLAQALQRVESPTCVMEQAKVRLQEKVDRLQDKLRRCRLDLDALRLWLDLRASQSRKADDLEGAEQVA